jgi:CheY-like chemotaxis protein
MTTTKPRKFLIVDDDTDDQEIFVAAVNEVDNSISCVAVDSCEDAINLLTHGSEDLPDFIFLDLNMPRMNGRQCLVELRKVALLNRIPIIIYSTSSLKKDIEETALLGADMFLTKPNKFDDLCKALNNVISLEWPRKTA